MENLLLVKLARRNKRVKRLKWILAAFVLGSYISNPHSHVPDPEESRGEESPILTPGPNYYDVLGLPRDATEREITRAWRRAVLLHHPDKQEQGRGHESSTHGIEYDPAGDGNADIRLINEAKWVLGDETRRKEWEEIYFSSNNEAIVRVDTTPHVSYDISLSAFTPHYRSAATNSVPTYGNGLESESEPAQQDEEPIYYTHPCRCSSEFVITYQDLEDGIEVVGCGGCGEWVRVGYEAVEEDFEEN